MSARTVILAYVGMVCVFCGILDVADRNASIEIKIFCALIWPATALFTVGAWIGEKLK